MGTVILLPNPRLSGAVRDAVNERARMIGASDEKRRHAVSKALTMLKLGHSSAWAVAEACRDLRGSLPATHGDYPNQPGAA